LKPWKRCRIITLIILLIVIVSCNSYNKRMISYGFGACNHSWGWTKITVYDNGLVIINSTKEFKLKIHQSAASKVFDALEKEHFFELNKSYINKNVVGGYCQEMLYNSDNMTKKVEIANTPVIQINRIADKLFKVLDDHSTNWRNYTSSAKK